MNAVLAERSIGVHDSSAASRSWTPVDPTLGELSLDERRTLIRRVADEVGRRMSEVAHSRSEAGRAMSSDEERVHAAMVVQQLLLTENEARMRRGVATLSATAHEALLDRVMARIYGLGELDELWHHPDVENIDCNGAFDVFVTFVGGHKVRWTPVAGSHDELIDLIRKAARQLGLVEVDFDARHPQLDVQLPDGSRLFAVFGGPTGNGVATVPVLCIRRHRFLKVVPDDLVRMGVWPVEVSRFLTSAFKVGVNLVVGGDWNSGKTTALRALCAAIPSWHRIVTIEAHLTELGLHHDPDRFPNVVPLFSRPPGAEGDGEVTVADLIMRASRRLNATVALIGEVMHGNEIGPVLDLMTGSTRGSACTIHAASARAVVRRFEQYGLMANPPLPLEAVRYGLAEAAPIVVHLTADESNDGTIRRFCTSVLEVTGIEDGRVSATELWSLDAGGRLAPTNALSSAKRERLARAGWHWQTDGWGDRLGLGSR